MNHLKNHNILSDKQHGYQQGCSTETQLLRVIDQFAKGLEKKTQIDCISLDFQLAFDIVPQERLLLKMRSYGLTKLVPWFKDFLSRRNQIVVVEGVHSRVIKMLSGIGQGTVVSGLCFLIFINNLPETITKSFTGLFCDDTLLSKEITCEEDSVELQNDLNNVHEWADTWGMRFNATKSVVMTITNKNKPFDNKYYLNNILPVQCLAKKTFIKYLGVTIDNKLTFKTHIQEKCHNATKVKTKPSFCAKIR